MNETALALRPQQTLAETIKVGEVMAQSGFFQDSRQAAQAIVKILAGQEMGFGPFASMTGVHIISGRPAVGANLMAAAVKGSGRYDYRVKQMTDTVCEVSFLQSGQEIGTSKFSIEDARKAGTKNMDKFPRNMLFARAMSNGVRWFCPDVFNGAAVYTPEELGASTDQDGNVIEGSYTPNPPATNGHTNSNGKLPPTNEATIKNQHNAAGVSWEELGGDDSPGTIDPDKVTFYRGKVQSNPRHTVATVCNAATMTGAYKSESHALNAAIGISADLEKGAKLTPEDALKLFDKLVERKQVTQLVTQPELIEGVQAISPYGDDHSYRNS